MRNGPRSRRLTESDETVCPPGHAGDLVSLGERPQAASQAEEAIHTDERGNASAPLPLRILACPARDQADRSGLEMPRQLLDPAKWDVEVAAVETMTADLAPRVAE